ncbi:MAG: ATP-NAD kinase [Candidatus Lokiarchaeota archaeon]|nr:ATP-NAD kinase [Candidatus Lokiarchaeota archaeon]
MINIGLIVNPIAGMGGSVGLKGTDGDLYKKAIELGADYVAPKRVQVFLESIQNKKRIKFYVAPGRMGAYYLDSRLFNSKIIGKITDLTSAEDTKQIAKLMIEETIDLLLFFGGDGTARDVYDAVGLETPVIGVPTGVKMFSSVFTINPRAAAELIDLFIVDQIEFEEREVLDIDEDAYRKGELKSELYGYLKVPKVRNLIQSAKDVSQVGNSFELNKKEIAQFFIESIKSDIVYFLGPGTTVKAITDELHLPKTLLGIDAFYNNQIIAQDLNEKDIINVINNYNDYKIVVSPIGGQGFIFGRGNKQFTPYVLKRIGIKNIIIISTAEKARELKGLSVDTGEKEIDELFSGLVKVIIGYKEERIMRIII